MSDAAPKTILLTGGSGLIGSALATAFSVNNLRAIKLVRRPALIPSEIQWNPVADPPVASYNSLENAFAAIHLSGANLTHHWWTPAFKREIYTSRVRTTRTLVDTLLRLKRPPRVLLCASAVGIYGNRNSEILTESSAPGQGFLADVCRAWEGEADRAAQAGTRVVHLRFGIVLAKDGGALKQMLPAFRFGVAGRLGAGNQWMSWIALDDLTRAVLHILQTHTPADTVSATNSIHQAPPIPTTNPITGPVNLVSPIPVTNREFTAAFARAVHRPAIVAVPRPILRLALGEMADNALLASTRAIPEKLAATGFHFNHPQIDNALQSIL